MTFDEYSEFERWMIVVVAKDLPYMAGGPMEITMQVNGVEVDARLMLKRLEGAMEDYAAQKARQLIASQLSELQYHLTEVKEAVDSMTTEFWGRFSEAGEN
jgi:hypothetical protein